VANPLPSSRRFLLLVLLPLLLLKMLGLLDLLQSQLQLWSMLLSMCYQVLYALHLCETTNGPVSSKESSMIHKKSMKKHEKA
jgi:hypothetical protein